MAGYIPEHIIAQVQSSIDIVGLISQYIPLKKAGRDFKGLCPFHKEKTPSFTVSPGKQIFHCFGCKEGGSVFRFLMLQERFTFPEAIRHLAQSAGIQIPEASGQNPAREAAEQSAREAIFAALGRAASYYSSLLRSEAGAGAREYLKHRRLSPTTIEQWQLGVSLKAWDTLLRALENQGFSRETLEKAGLITAGAEGKGYYDRFRHRVMFPIVDARDRVIGFGARILGEEDGGGGGPKYLNSPETPVFNKGGCLYGLHRAKSSLTEKGVAVVVEGYTDVLMAHQMGVTNVVATLGTALTKNHIDLLRRYARRVVMVYDADEAGEKASDRSIDLFLEEDVDVSLATLVSGLDPCSFLLEYGARAFEERVEQAQELLGFKLQRARSKYNFNLMDDKSRATDEVLALVPKISNEIKRDLFLQAAAAELRLAETTLRARVAALGRKTGRTSAPSAGAKVALRPTTAAQIAQRDVVSFILKFSQTPPSPTENSQSLFQKVSTDEFADESYRAIYQTLRDLYETEGQVDSSRVLTALETRSVDPLAARIVAEILAEEADASLPLRLQGSVTWFSQKRKQRKVLELKEQMREAQTKGDSDRVRQLLQQVQACFATGPSQN